MDTVHNAVRTRTPVLVALATLAACSSKPGPQPNPVVPVTVAVARRGAAPLVITANGQMDPQETASVVAQVNGVVTDVAFREGDWVRQGQVLFRIDPRPYADALGQARAALARDTATAAYARRFADRMSALARKDYVTASDAESSAATAEANAATVASDVAMVRKADFDLANTVIRASIAGRTGSVLVHRGNYVTANPNEPLVVINRTDPILVRFSAPASVFDELQVAGRPKPLMVRVRPTDAGTAAGSVAPNSPAADSAMGISVTPGTASVAESQGTLSFVDNAVDTTTGTVRLKAQLANPDGRFWPGQFAFISLQLSVQQNALLVPSLAVQAGQQPAVYVVQPDSQAVRRPVTLGATVGPLVVVTSGLAEGERVITDGQSRLTARARVRVVGVDSTAQVASAAP